MCKNIQYSAQSQTVCENRTESYGSHADRQATQNISKQGKFK